VSGSGGEARVVVEVVSHIDRPPRILEQFSLSPASLSWLEVQHRILVRFGITPSRERRRRRLECRGAGQDAEKKGVARLAIRRHTHASLQQWPSGVAAKRTRQLRSAIIGSTAVDGAREPPYSGSSLASRIWIW
jgi:hypothetical protein